MGSKRNSINLPPFSPLFYGHKTGLFSSDLSPTSDLNKTSNTVDSEDRFLKPMGFRNTLEEGRTVIFNQTPVMTREEGLFKDPQTRDKGSNFFFF